MEIKKDGYLTPEVEVVVLAGRNIVILASGDNEEYNEEEI